MSYNVTAVHWKHGWELHIEDVGVTQSHTLDGAPSMVRDYLELDGRSDAQTAVLHIAPQLDDVQVAVDEAKQLTEDAVRFQGVAAAKRREVVAALRARGLSVADTASVMGVSKGRISQLTG